jgi:hypothetical protein
MTQSDWAAGPGDSAPPTERDVDAAESTPVDLDEIERDLRDVESALARLADGTYFPQHDAQHDAGVPGTDASGSPADSAAPLDDAAGPNGDIGDTVVDR